MKTTLQRLLVLTAALVPWLLSPAVFADPELAWKNVGTDPPQDRHKDCRHMLVGPGKNQPANYEGYNGFVGWTGTSQLQSGRWIVTFSSGHWHASYPWTDEIRERCQADPKVWARFQAWRGFGLSDLRSPRGGRTHFIYSDDEGKTWSKPKPLIDTELDDRHPTILELDGGTLFCTFFSSSFLDPARVFSIRSSDDGNTWSKPMQLGAKGEPLGKEEAFGNGSLILLPNGTLVIATQADDWPGKKLPEKTGNVYIGVYRSSDRGETFELAATVPTRPNGDGEPGIARLPDGRLVLIVRRNGDVYWSNDDGQTWTEPRSTGVDMYDPHLVVLPNGVLACFHGSYGAGGLRVILSPDGGSTWHGPKERIGYAVDPSVYGYSHPLVLPDGTIYLTYLHTGGHLPEDARTEAIWGLRLDIKDKADGIEILPALGSAAAASQSR